MVWDSFAITLRPQQRGRERLAVSPLKFLASGMALRPDLSQIESALKGAPLRTRFAPSPTGYLHQGHLVNMIYVWGIAQAMGGRVVLRMEDHDRNRCKPIFEQAILEVMDWLGFEPDVAPRAAFEAGSSDYRQRDSGHHYAQALASLQAQGLAYACTCSRKQVKARTGQLQGELYYDGHCRDAGLEALPGRSMRLRMADDVLDFQDMLAGAQRQRPQAEVGDFLLRDNKGNWTYQMAVVVDDMRHGINTIIRGLDILPSTGRQILLMRALGHESWPIYAHHGLILGEDGEKLSKSNRAPDLITLKENGEDPRALLASTLRLLGFDIDQQVFNVSDLKFLFS